MIGTVATAGRATTRPEGALLRLHLGMEGLWLLTAALVPLILVPPDSMIVYHYVPKVALLRTLVGLMTILWVLEWALRGPLQLAHRPGTPLDQPHSLAP